MESQTVKDTEINYLICPLRQESMLTGADRLLVLKKETDYCVYHRRCL